METTPDTFPALFAGYAVIWICILLYLVRLEMRMRKLEKGDS
jgi:CcmD family protein